MARSTASSKKSPATHAHPAGTQMEDLEDEPPTTLRRSGRARRPGNIKLTEVADDADELAASPTYAKSVKAAADETRRNPKRRAAPEIFDIPEEILEEALKPMADGEVEDWQGWVEFESDPAFFNVILQDLGVKDVKIQEVFSLDEGSLSFLPKPVHGLIFLYQYVEEDAQEESENGHNVWFANQTTDNACATVALLNIIMNASSIALGPQLSDFKTTSSPLSPPLKGDLLTNTTWIRSIHNQFARRLDLLNADLALANEAKAASKKKTSAARSQHMAKRARHAKPSTDAAYHFIAYVPVGEEVYQLDGLEKAPLCIGKMSEETTDWTDVARPFIESRMLQYESEQLSFNLLALCRSPLIHIREELVRNIGEYETLSRSEWKIVLKAEGGRSPTEETLTASYPPETGGHSAPEGFVTVASSAEHLAPFGLAKPLNYDMETHHPILTDAPDPDDREGIKQMLAMRREELEMEQVRLRAEYEMECSMRRDDARMAGGRKKDYTPFIHRWVEKLADMEVLQEIAEDVAMQQA